MKDAKPSLTQRALAVIVLAVVAIVALRLAIGAITAVFWIVALVALAIATLWAVGTLRGVRSGRRDKRVERSSPAEVAPAAYEDRVEAQMRRYHRVTDTLAGHGKPPFVAVEQFRQQFGAQSTPITRGPVDVQSFWAGRGGRSRPARVARIGAGLTA